MRLCAAIALLTLASACLAAGAAPNQMPNGSFEETDAFGVPASYAISGTANMTMAVDTQVKRNGRQSIRLTAKGVTEQYAGLILTKGIKLDGPAIYKVSVWAKAENAKDNAGANEAGLMWFWVKPGSSEQRLPGLGLYTNGGTHDWTLYERELEVPCPVTLSSSGFATFNGTVWVDDISITLVRKTVTQTDRGATPQRLAARFPKALRSSDYSFAVLFAPSVRKITRKVSVKDGALTAGPRATVSLAKGEHEAVQLIVAPLKNEPLELSARATGVRRPGGFYLANARVSVNPVGYIGYRDGDKIIGEPMPDPLLEGSATVRPGELQPLWVDVYVPPGTTAAKYETDVTITNSKGGSVTVPIDVNVYDFELPKVPTLPTAMAASNAAGKRMLMEHRVGLLWMCMGDPAFDGREREFSEVRPIVEKALDEVEALGGSHFDIEMPRLRNTFNGGGDSIGGFSKWRSSYSQEQIDYIIRYYRDYAAYLKQRGMLDRGSVYLFDEPDVSVLDEVKKLREIIRKADPDIKCMVAGWLWPEMAGYIDTWIAGMNEFDSPEKVAFARQRQAAGDKMWFYIVNQTKPYPDWLIDPNCDLLSARMVFWIANKMKFDGFGYWTADYFIAHTGEFVRLGDTTDCYTINGYGDYGAGAGLLFYPAPVDVKEAASVKPETPQKLVSTIRLEAIRDGLEDYDYFAILTDRVAKAKAKGLNTKAVREVQKLLILPDSLAKDFTHYSHNPTAVLKWREKVARAIEAVGFD